MKKLVVGLALSCAALCSSAVNADIWDGVCPQIGLDAKYAYVKPKSDWRNIVKKNYWGFNLYALFRFCDCWGLELGYEHLFRANKRRTFGAGETFFGTDVSGRTFRSGVSFNTFHADVNWYYGICDCWDTILSVGAAYTKPRFRNRDDGFDVGHFKGRLLPRARAGLQYMMWPCVGLRGLIGWDNTSRIHAHHHVGIDGHHKPFKDTWSASLGLFWTFA